MTLYTETYRQFFQAFGCCCLFKIIVNSLSLQTGGFSVPLLLCAQVPASHPYRTQNSNTYEEHFFIQSSEVEVGCGQPSMS